MVRIKHRYLLIEILYPFSPAKALKDASSALPDTVLFHAPSPDYLTPALLVRTIRDKIADLYGDYGVGIVGNSLAGSLPHLSTYKTSSL
jgi:ribonuclease P/MRP protein subunit POP5